MINRIRRATWLRLSLLDRWLLKELLGPLLFFIVLFTLLLLTGGVMFELIRKIVDNLGYLAAEYDARLDCHDAADDLNSRLSQATIERIFEAGLHEFLEDFINRNNALGLQIEKDYRFYG